MNMPEKNAVSKLAVHRPEDRKAVDVSQNVHKKEKHHILQDPEINRDEAEASTVIIIVVGTQVKRAGKKGKVRKVNEERKVERQAILAMMQLQEPSSHMNKDRKAEVKEARKENNVDRGILNR